MNRTMMRNVLRLGLAMTLVGAVAGETRAQGTKKNYDEQFAAYLEAARVATATPRFWMGDLTSDLAARRVNDLVTVRIEEAVSASGTADMSIAKKSSAAAAMPSPASTYLAKFLPTASDAKTSGSGATSRTTALTAMMTARVLEVLPSGDLVVEGVREIDINGDRQVVVLSGVLRPVDILPGNVIPSSRIGQFRIRVLSQGMMRDSLSPGWLIRILNKIF